MIRRPRFPLTLRLGWIEAELNDAAQLMQLLTRDMIAFRQRAETGQARLVLVASVAVGSLVALGIDPALLERFVDHVAREGDLDEGEELAADILGQVMLLMARSEGEAH